MCISTSDSDLLTKETEAQLLGPLVRGDLALLNIKVLKRISLEF